MVITGELAALAEWKHCPAASIVISTFAKNIFANLGLVKQPENTPQHALKMQTQDFLWHISGE